mmetsp:Transcript_16424/g.22221  ORF Transcript_16424/g.22221 Transcript_16424/m.22221 type:complete len:259 (-) Transcript_16424:45-821(-)
MAISAAVTVNAPQATASLNTAAALDSAAWAPANVKPKSTQARTAAAMETKNSWLATIAALSNVLPMVAAPSRAETPRSTLPAPSPTPAAPLQANGNLAAPVASSHAASQAADQASAAASLHVARLAADPESAAASQDAVKARATSSAAATATVVRLDTAPATGAATAMANATATAATVNSGELKLNQFFPRGATSLDLLTVSPPDPTPTREEPRFPLLAAFSTMATFPEAMVLPGLTADGDQPHSSRLHDSLCNIALP